MRTSIAFVGLLLAVVPATAEDLYDKDGVQLWTSVRLVTRDAATCRVLEDRHPDEEYGRLKANEGQSLHVWRLDLTAANYSGKVIEHLRASVDVESEWPPCTNWDWNVQQDYPGGVDWAGGILSLPRVSDIPVGEEVRETMFLVVFRDQEPGFGRWTIDYSFAEATAPPASADRGAGSERRPSGGSARSRSAPPSRSAAAAVARREPPAASVDPAPVSRSSGRPPRPIGREVPPPLRALVAELRPLEELAPMRCPRTAVSLAAQIAEWDALTAGLPDAPGFPYEELVDGTRALACRVEATPGGHGVWEIFPTAARLCGVCGSFRRARVRSTWSSPATGCRRAAGCSCTRRASRR